METLGGYEDVSRMDFAIPDKDIRRVTPKYAVKEPQLWSEC
jgi:hypothetical protein